MKALFFKLLFKVLFSLLFFHIFPFIFFKLFLNLRPKSPPGRSTDPFESRFYKRTPSPPSPHVSRSESRPSFSLRGHRKPSPDISDLEEKALLTLGEIHNKEIELYKKNPRSHPDYVKERKIYTAVKAERARLTGDITDMKQVEEEWEGYWNYRLAGLLEESWISKREECLAALRRGKKRTDSRDSSSSSSDCDSTYEKELGQKSLKKRSSGNFREKSRSVSPSRKRRKGRESSVFPFRSIGNSREKKRSASPLRERKRGRNSSPPAEHHTEKIQDSLFQDIFRRAQENENANVKGNKNQHGREEAEAGLDLCVSDLFAEIGDDLFTPSQSETTESRGRHGESVSMPPHCERTESRGRHEDANVFSKETGSSRTDTGSHSGRRERHDDERYSRKIESSRIDYQEGEPSLLSKNEGNLVSKMATALNHLFKGGINDTIVREVLKLLPESVTPDERWANQRAAENAGATQPQPEDSDPTSTRRTAVYPPSRIVGEPPANENSPFQLGLELSRIPGLYKPAVPDQQQDTPARTFRVKNSGSGISSPPYLLPYSQPFSGRPAGSQMTGPTREAGEALRSRSGIVYPLLPRAHRPDTSVTVDAAFQRQDLPPTVVDIGSPSQPQTPPASRQRAPRKNSRKRRRKRNRTRPTALYRETKRSPPRGHWCD